MRFTIAALALLISSAMFADSGISASDVEELRTKAATMREEVSLLLELGKKEEAVRLERELQQILEQAEKLENRAREQQDRAAARSDDTSQKFEPHRLRERSLDLLAQELKLSQTGATEEELNAIRRQRRELILELKKRGDGVPRMLARMNEQQAKFAAANQRLTALRQAAQLLKRAEVHDLAKQVEEKATALERDMREAKERMAAAMHSQEHGVDDDRNHITAQLRAELQALRAELRELRARVQERD